ncbi:uncharacterized protein [Malus domestica]|uniref:uncharacterized protein isoform X3 n=1 Tax=Malus domestica TaxID=3750 RepID=UPI0039765B8B
MMGRRCRVWWPKQLSLRKPSSSSSNFLLGWFVSSSPSSLDVVVAFACTELALSGIQSTLQGLGNWYIEIIYCFQGILRDTNGRMPVLLQDKSMMCVLGQIFEDQIEEDQSHSSCGCHKLSGSVGPCRENFEGNGYWIRMLCDPQEHIGKDITWIPKLHHVHWNGKVVSRCDVHLILYETPTYGAHHFSLHPWNSFEQVSAPMRKPKWVDELHQKQPLLDLDTVILAINSSATAEIVFEKCIGPKTSFVCFSTVYMFLGFTWQLFAMSVASLSTLFYVVLQFLYSLLNYASDSCINLILVKVFSSSRINIRIRGSQILYWPIFLQYNGMRGRKWNPLRQRLDSYDYTVKQHIVGSLLFTPLLLLLPTTSVFYIFFTIMNTTISLMCILIEVTISFIHATPYIKIFLWLVRPRRFPSGIWFEIVSVWSGGIDSPSDINSPSEKLQPGKGLTGEKSSVVVSFLHSNFLTVGQIVMPHYNKVLSGKPRTLVATAAYGVLTGRRIPSSIGTDLPTFPWMLISYKEYWRLCRDSVLVCYRA